MQGRVRGGLVIGVTLSVLITIPGLGAAPAAAGMDAAARLVADNGKPRSLTTKDADLPPAVNPAAGNPAANDPGAVRAILDMPELAWSDLSSAEATVLMKLDWSRSSWDRRADPSASWPQSMTTKFLNLTAVQKASVRNLGYRPLEWDLRVRNRMLSAR